MHRFTGDQQGLTLVEVMIAAAIISVGLAGIAAAFQVAAYGVQEGRQLSTATLLANERLEQARTARWEVGPPGLDDLGVSPSSTAAPLSGGITTFPDEPALAGSYAGYARTVRVADCGVGGGCAGVINADLRQVTVTVSYRAMTATGVAAAGTTKSATIITYVAQR
jgi:prepilin-type N-terminal cleavage/methylation domain-containing protein